MMILALKSSFRSRVFLCPVLQPRSSASAASLASHFHRSTSSEAFSPSLIPIDSNSEFRAPDSAFVFRFNRLQNPNLDQIFKILRSLNEEDRNSIKTADLALTELGFRISESFVLEVLRYGSDVLSCLKFFEWAGKQPCFCHTHATIQALFEILLRAKLTPSMFNLVDSFKSISHGLAAKPPSNDNLLVIGYAVAGKPQISLQMMGRMRFSGSELNPIAYNVVLNALVECRSFDMAHAVLNQMKIRGYENEITHFIAVKSLCKQNHLDKAKDYLRGLVGDGKVVNGNSLSVLVDALYEKKRLEDASILVDEFRELGSVPMKETYDVLIRRLVQAGKLEHAFVLLQERKEVFHCNMLIFKLLKENKLFDAFDLLTEMKELQIVPDRLTTNTVMRSLCKAGMVDVALKMHDKQAEFGLTPNGLVFKFLVNSLFGYCSTDEALCILKTLLEQGTFQGAKAVSFVADALCRAGNFGRMVQLLVIGLNHGVKPTDSLCNKLITTLCRVGRVEDGYLIHGEFSRLNGVTTGETYGHMIHGFSHINRGDNAARLLIEMQQKGEKPTRGLLATVLQCLLSNKENAEQRFLQLLAMQLKHHESNSYIFGLFMSAAGRVNRPDLVRQVYEMMRRNGITPNLDSDIVMLQSYLKCQKIADAFNFIDEVGKRGPIEKRLYRAMVIGLCRAKRADYALETIREVERNGFVLSPACYGMLMNLLCSEGKYDEAVQLFNRMERNGLTLSSYISNTFVSHALKSRDLHEAWKRSRDHSCETPNTSLLGELIAAFSHDSGPDFRAEQMEEVIQRCFPLDTVTYNVMLRRLAIDQVDEALRLFDRMRRKGYRPNRWTYNAVVFGLLKHGRRDEAMRWMGEMSQLGFHLFSTTKSFL